MSRFFGTSAKREISAPFCWRRSSSLALPQALHTPVLNIFLAPPACFLHVCCCILAGNTCCQAYQRLVVPTKFLTDAPDARGRSLNELLRLHATSRHAAIGSQPAILLAQREIKQPAPATGTSYNQRAGGPVCAPSMRAHRPHTSWMETRM